MKFYNLTLEATTLTRKRRPALKAVLVAGPLFRDWHLLQSVAGVTVVPFEPDMSSRLAQAKLVICQAGYNTVAELVQLGTKAILVPADRQWDDQFARAKLTVREYPTFRVFLGRAATDLALLAVDFMDEPDPPDVRATTCGRTRAAQVIYKLLE